MYWAWIMCFNPFEGNVDFYFYLLQTLQDSFDNQSTGTTFKAISGEIIRNENIILPPSCRATTHSSKNRRIISCL